MKMRYYDPEQRAHEKQLARERDERDLASGRISREDLRSKNSMFAGIDVSKGRIIRRNSIG